MSQENASICIGISSCLLGEKVRFDGNHKQDNYITGTLSRQFHFIPICPEMAIGLGVPREPVRLEGDPEQPRVIGTRNKTLDVTAALEDFAQRTAAKLAGISGYILKKGSPSCGMERVKVYRPGAPPRWGQGVFACGLRKALPLLPMEEEGRLGDPALRENFFERIFAYRRWQLLEAEGITAQRLVAFHSTHKLILLAHNRQQYTALGHLAAEAGKSPLKQLATTYIHAFMAALARPATTKRHSDVMQHLMGYLKKQLMPEEKAELLELIEQYRLGRIPRLVPITLLRHHFRRHPHPYIEQQHYLNSHPWELMLY